MIIVINNLFVTFFPRKKVTKEIFAELETLPAQASHPTGVAFGHFGDVLQKYVHILAESVATRTCRHSHMPSISASFTQCLSIASNSGKYLTLIDHKHTNRSNLIIFQVFLLL